MAQKVDTRLLWKAAELAVQWHNEETKNRVREDFAKFAKPYWSKRGGEEYVNHMMSKYVHNDNLSIVEYLYNLDHRNKRLVAKYLMLKAEGYDEQAWSIVDLDEEE